MSRSIYLVVPDWSGDPEDAHESVVDSLLHGPHYIQLALDLWRLAGNEERVSKIKAILSRAHGRENKDLDAEDIRELDGLLEGLETALKQSVVDDQLLIPPERLPGLRRKAKIIDLEDSPEQAAVEAISEANSRVHLLREFLRQALHRDLHVALD